MAKLSTTIIFIYLLVASNLKGMVNGTNLEHVLKQGDRLQVGFNKKFQDGRCHVAMKAWGSLVVLKQKQKKEMKLMWQTGLAPGHVSGDEYKLQLKDKGNMAIKRVVSPDGPKETVTVYDTHTDGDVGEYFLGINHDCVLEIHEGTIDEPGDMVWTNVKTRMKSGDTLGTSEIFSDYGDGCDKHFMYMSPNGNLEIYEGIDFADGDEKEPVWESNTKRKRGDYQFRIGENAVLSLHDVATGEEYWKKDLQNSGRPPTSITWLSLISFGCEVRDNGVGPYEWFWNEDNVFMREGDRLPAGSIYGTNRCTLFLQYDGRLDVDDSYNLNWSSGKAKDDTISDEYFLMLHETGNLVMYRGTIDNPGARLWATHTRGEIGNYFLSTNPFCDLKIFEGTPEEKGKLVWSNRITKLKSGDRLIKAQYFTPTGFRGLFMVLVPDTGMLGIYDDSCLFESFYEYPECFKYPQWSFDTGLGDYDDFYMKVGYDGKLRFYGISGDGDVLMKKQFDLGEIGEEFEVALYNENGSILPTPITV